MYSQHKSCWSWRQLLYVTLFFISPLFQCLFNLEFQNLLLSVASFLCCVHFSSPFFLSCTLFYSSFYSMFCFLPLFIHFIFWSPLLFSFQICYPLFYFFLLLCFVCFSHMLLLFNLFSFYILVFIFLDPSV